jgi:hypothetical protein
VCVCVAKDLLWKKEEEKREEERRGRRGRLLWKSPAGV